MQYRLVKPLVLAIGLGLAGIAAAGNFDAAGLSSNISPCQDFNGYVNAKWIAAHPITVEGKATTRACGTADHRAHRQLPC